MGKVNLLDLTREEFAEWISKASIEDLERIYPKGTGNKGYNTVFNTIICGNKDKGISRKFDERCKYRIVSDKDTSDLFQSKNGYLSIANGGKLIKGVGKPKKQLVKYSNDHENIQSIITRILGDEAIISENFKSQVRIIEENMKGFGSVDVTMRNTNDENKEIYLFKEIDSLIKNGNKQIILTGPPGTGKTYTARAIQEKCPGVGNEISKNFVQFHPSYDYVDFVEGIRPTESNDQMIFRKMDGIFKRFCREVIKKGDKSKKYVFIIDEINRADLSKVFGELLFALEEDKRGKNNRIQTQYSQLPNTYEVNEDGEVQRIEDDVFAEGFYVPENVIILATMNDIDRSVESIDFAFRRRFKWIKVDVNKELLGEAIGKMLSDRKEKEKEQEQVIQAIIALNNFIKKEGKKYLLDENYFISQGYFRNLPKIEEIDTLLESVWDYRIKHTIEEYVRGEHEASGFVEGAKQAFLLKNPPEEEDDGSK